MQKRHWICSSTRTLRSCWKRWSHNWRGTLQTRCPASLTGSSIRFPMTTGLWTRRYTHRHIHTYLQFVFFYLHYKIVYLRLGFRFLTYHAELYYIPVLFLIPFLLLIGIAVLCCYTKCWFSKIPQELWFFRECYCIFKSYLCAEFLINRYRNLAWCWCDGARSTGSCWFKKFYFNFFFHDSPYGFFCIDLVV